MARKKHEPKATTLHTDVHELFDSPLGTRVLDGLTKRFHDQRAKSLDPQHLAHREGQRDVVLLLTLYATSNLEEIDVLDDGTEFDD